MRHGDEGVQTLEWAYATLTQDEALAEALGVPLEDLEDRVWEGVAPAGTPTPWVIISTGEALPVNGVGPVPRLMVRAPLTAKVVGQVASYSPLAEAARAIYAALHAVTNAPVDDGVVASVQQVGTVQYPERVEGIEYRHLGHLLQVNVE